MIDITAFFIGTARVIFAFLVLMVIPGLSVSLIFFPALTDISMFRRIVLSGTLSIGIIITGLLILDLFLGVDITPASLLAFLLVITVFVLVIWSVEIVIIRWSQIHGARTSTKIHTWWEKHNPLVSGPVSRIRRRIMARFRRGSP